MQPFLTLREKLDPGGLATRVDAFVWMDPMYDGTHPNIEACKCFVRVTAQHGARPVCADSSTIDLLLDKSTDIQSQVRTKIGQLKKTALELLRSKFQKFAA